MEYFGKFFANLQIRILVFEFAALCECSDVIALEEQHGCHARRTLAELSLEIAEFLQLVTNIVVLLPVLQERTAFEEPGLTVRAQGVGNCSNAVEETTIDSELLKVQPYKTWQANPAAKIQEIRRSLQQIQEAISQGAATPAPAAPAPAPAVNPQEEMLRSFPGLYGARGRSRRGRGRGGQAYARGRQPPSCEAMEVQFFLLEKDLDKTPLPSEEGGYVAAGLGPQTVAIKRSMDHKQVELNLFEAYPRLRELEGGWLLKKAVGSGPKARPLVFAAASQAGYPGEWFRQNWKAKSAKLYIVPMQSELSTEPLPVTAQEFRQTPKTACQSCGEDVPIPLLAEHLGHCTDSDDESVEETSSTMVGDGQVAIGGGCDDGTTAVGNGRAMVETLQSIFPNETREDIAQALEACQDNPQLAAEYLLAGTSAASRSFSRPLASTSAASTSAASTSAASTSAPSTSAPSTSAPSTSAASTGLGNGADARQALQALQQHVQSNPPTRIYTSHDTIFEDGVQLFKRPQFNPLHPTQVSFQTEGIKQAGVDAGGLTKEFFTLFFQHCTSPSRGLFESPSTHPNFLLPVCKGSAVRGPLLKIIGQAVAVSIANRGATFPFLSPPVFAYMSQAEPQQETWPAETLLPRFLPDGNVRRIVEELLECSSQEALTAMLEEDTVFAVGGEEVEKTTLGSILLDMNFNIQPTLSNKEYVAQEVLFHHLVQRRMAGLEKFKCGLKTLNFLHMLQSNPEYFRSMLTPAGSLTYAELRGTIMPTITMMMEDESLSTAQQETVGHMKRFLDELEAAQSGEDSYLAEEMSDKEFPEKMFQFVTSLCSVPAYEQLQINIDFLEEAGTNELPESSTCGNTLLLPVGLGYDEFKRRIVIAVTVGYLGADKSLVFCLHQS
ncbi:hypothetical protein Bbelb_438840 [Branchiostoma belcheri]|nr:hypothetical protein Bbelb_438840 [Branchiostoma belcheri]